MIEVQHIRKEFKTPVVKEGRFSGLRTLFTRNIGRKKRCGESVLRSGAVSLSDISDPMVQVNQQPSKC